MSAQEGKKKATDLLIEIDNRLRAIEKRLSVFDFQQKLLINGLNKLAASKNGSNQTPIEQAQPIKQEAKPLPEVVQSKKESILEKKARLMHIEKRSKDDSEYSFDVSNLKTDKSQETVAPEQEPINTNNSVLTSEAQNTANTTKVPVTQKASLYDGTPIALAEVIITNIITGDAKKLSTGNNGRWQTPLLPGTYTVKVSGKVGGDVVEYSQNFNVPFTDSVLDIPPPEVYKKRPKDRKK